MEVGAAEELVTASAGTTFEWRRNAEVAAKATARSERLCADPETLPAGSAASPDPHAVTDIVKTMALRSTHNRGLDGMLEDRWAETEVLFRILLVIGRDSRQL
jgi:hypothetical protein